MNSLSCVNECYRFSRCTGFFFLGRTICTVGNLSSFIRRFQFNSSLHCRPWAGQAHHEALAVSPSSMSAWSLAAFHFTSWEEGFLKKKKIERKEISRRHFSSFFKKKSYMAYCWFWVWQPALDLPQESCELREKWYSNTYRKIPSHIQRIYPYNQLDYPKSLIFYEPKLC